jgi:tetratricopeptide (TPR) repeat protein
MMILLILFLIILEVWLLAAVGITPVTLSILILIGVSIYYFVKLRDVFKNPHSPHMATSKGQTDTDNPEQAASAALKLGTQKIMEMNLKEALKLFTKAIEIKPDYYLAYSSRGDTYAIMNLKEEAIKDFNRCIELNHRHAAAYTGRGNVYYTLGKLNLAKEDLKKAIELDPKGMIGEVAKKMLEEISS